MKHSTKTRRNHDTTPPAALPRPDIEHELTEALARRVRFLSVAQAVRTWWPLDKKPLQACRSCLRRLATCGEVELFDELSHAELPLAEPLAAWQPGQPPPDFAAISYRAKSRWPGPSVRTELVRVTEAGAARHRAQAFRRPRTSETTHDLHMAAVYLLMRKELPTRSASWRPESVLAEWMSARGRTVRGEQKLPDAMVRDGRAHTAIEFVGDYPPAKLAAFHEFCRHQGWGYELW